MSSMSGRGSGFGAPGRPQTGNVGQVPSLDQPQHRGGQGDGGMAGAVKDKVNDLTSSASEMAGQVRDTAKEWAGSAADTVGQGWDSTRQTVQGGIDEATAFIRRHPGASLLAAFGLGTLIGCCLVMMTEDRGPRRYYQ
jgi:hypothetical protein